MTVVSADLFFYPRTGIVTKRPGAREYVVLPLSGAVVSVTIEWIAIYGAHWWALQPAHACHSGVEHRVGSAGADAGVATADSHVTGMVVPQDGEYHMKDPVCGKNVLQE